MNFHEFHWISLNFHEFHWISMNFIEFQWISQEFQLAGVPKNIFFFKMVSFSRQPLAGMPIGGRGQKQFLSLKGSLFPGRPQGVLKASFWVPKASVWVCWASFWVPQAPQSEWPGPHSECPGSWDHSILASRHASILGSESWDRGILASRHSRASQHPGILASSTLTQPQRLLHLNAYSTSTLIPLKT